MNALWLEEQPTLSDSSKGPINAIKPVLKVPSHHGPDVMTVKPEISINSMAIGSNHYNAPSRHRHNFTRGHGLTTESVIEMWSSKPRISIMNGAETGITTLLK